MRVEGSPPPQGKNPPVYLTTHLYNYHTKRKQMVRALLDSGNTVGTTAAMSARLATQLGISYKAMTFTCGTAGEGQSVLVKGLARNIRIALTPKTIVNMGRVVIIEGLSGGLNLGAKFLMELGAGLQFNKDGTATLTLGKLNIPLHSKRPNKMHEQTVTECNNMNKVEVQVGSPLEDYPAGSPTNEKYSSQY